jgi:hypothetical protein
VTEPQLILQFKSDSQETVTNFQRFSGLVIEEVAKLNVNISIETIFDGAILFFQDLFGYRIFHNTIHKLLNDLTDREKKYVIHENPFTLTIKALKSELESVEDWGCLIVEHYRRIYPKIQTEYNHDGLILRYLGKKME